MNTAPIANPQITIVPSDELIEFVENLPIKSDDSDVPAGIKSLIEKTNVCETKRKLIEHRLFYNADDRTFVKKLHLPKVKLPSLTSNKKTKGNNTNSSLLYLEDLYWLHDQIHKRNQQTDDKVYLHDMLKSCVINLPKNVEIPRNEELEKRCQKLKTQQQNKEYSTMTKNVDSVRKKLPEDTISYQLKQMNRHLIAVFQFIVSILAGFAFGFIGVELIVGNLDFGFRLLLGIICALVIALAELYFLAKKLNEDLDFELRDSVSAKKVKVN